MCVRERETEREREIGRGGLAPVLLPSLDMLKAGMDVDQY